MIGLAELFKKRLDASVLRERILKAKVGQLERRLSHADALADYHDKASRQIAGANRALAKMNAELVGELDDIDNLRAV